MYTGNLKRTLIIMKKKVPTQTQKKNEMHAIDANHCCQETTYKTDRHKQINTYLHELYSFRNERGRHIYRRFKMHLTHTNNGNVEANTDTHGKVFCMQ